MRWVNLPHSCGLCTLFELNRVLSNSIVSKSSLSNCSHWGLQSLRLCFWNMHKAFFCGHGPFLCCPIAKGIKLYQVKRLGIILPNTFEHHGPKMYCSRFSVWSTVLEQLSSIIPCTTRSWFGWNWACSIVTSKLRPPWCLPRMIVLRVLSRLYAVACC